MRQRAAEYLCSLTSTKEGCEMIANKRGHIALTKLLGDSIVSTRSVFNCIGNKQICDYSSY